MCLPAYPRVGEGGLVGLKMQLLVCFAATAVRLHRLRLGVLHGKGGCVFWFEHPGGIMLDVINID